jgi:hypothetical protein
MWVSVCVALETVTTVGYWERPGHHREPRRTASARRAFRA